MVDAPGKGSLVMSENLLVLGILAVSAVLFVSDNTGWTWWPRYDQR